MINNQFVRDRNITNNITFSTKSKNLSKSKNIKAIKKFNLSIFNIKKSFNIL